MALMDMSPVSLFSIVHQVLKSINTVLLTRDGVTLDIPFCTRVPGI